MANQPSQTLFGGVSNSTSPSGNGDPVIFQLTTDIGVSVKTSVLPHGVSWSKESNINWTRILNRASPVATWADSSPIRMVVGLEFMTLQGDPAKETWDPLSSLLSLVFPEEDGTKAPTLCYVTIGSGLMWDDWECVCASVSGAAGAEHKIYSPDGDPLHATCEVTFMGIDQKNVVASKWKKSGSITQLAF